MLFGQVTESLVVFGRQLDIEHTELVADKPLVEEAYQVDTQADLEELTQEIKKADSIEVTGRILKEIG